MGIFLVVLAGLAFTLSSYFGKIVTNLSAMSGVINSFSRFTIGTICMFLYILYTRKSFKARDIKPIVTRTIYNSISIMLFSLAHNYTTITNINMLHMTHPLFVILITPFFTGEKPKKSAYIYSVIIFIGSYVVANPSFGNVNFGDLLSLLSSIAGAISLMYLTISRYENEGYIIVFYVMFIGALINLPFAAKDIVSFDLSVLFYVILAGAFGFLGQILLTWGYKYVDSSTGALVSTSRIVIGALIGYLFLSEPMTINIITGIVLITGSLIGLSGFFDKKKELVDQ